MIVHLLAHHTRASPIWFLAPGVLQAILRTVSRTARLTEVVVDKAEARAKAAG
jgi:hypothetical protein